MDKSVISVYKILSDTDLSDWEAAWDYVEEHLNTKAICKQVIRLESSVEEAADDLKFACAENTELNSILLLEREAGATHAFAGPVTGGAIFGVPLDRLK